MRKCRGYMGGKARQKIGNIDFRFEWSLGTVNSLVVTLGIQYLIMNNLEPAGLVQSSHPPVLIFCYLSRADRTLSHYSSTKNAIFIESAGSKTQAKTIVYRVDWLWSPPNIKGANKDVKIYVGRSTTVHMFLFCAHTLCMNYVTKTFLLLCSSVRSKQLLCFVHGQGQKPEQKHTTKISPFPSINYERNPSSFTQEPFPVTCHLESPVM